MNKNLRLLLFLAVSTSVACTANRTAAPFTPVTADAEHTVIYVYRPAVMANTMYTPELYINNEYRAPVRSGEHYHFTLMPGLYSLRLNLENSKTNELAAEALVAASVYYYRVTTSLKLNDAVRYQPYQRQFTLTPMDAKLARQQISQCCLKDKQAKEKPDDDAKKTGEIDHGGTGFSVDKTQNPFSH